MRAIVPSAFAALAVALLPAQDPVPAAAPKAGPAEAEYQLLDKEFKAAQAAYTARVRAVQQTDEYKAALARMREQKSNDATELRALMDKVEKVDLPAFAKRAWEGAERVAGQDSAVPFLVWIAVNDPDKASTTKAVDCLLERHIADPGLVGLAERAIALNAKLGRERAAQVLQALVDGESIELVKAHALYLQASMVLRDREASAEAKAAAEAKLARAEQLAAGTELAIRIAGPRFEKERLQIGMAAPDIEGVDLDGAPFKLSDYRGKVVVLDFWGDW